MREAIEYYIFVLVKHWRPQRGPEGLRGTFRKHPRGPQTLQEPWERGRFRTVPEDLRDALRAPFSEPLWLSFAALRCGTFSVFDVTTGLE